MKGFEARTPIVARGTVDKFQSILELANKDTVAKDYLMVNNVQIFVDGAINWYNAWCFWNSCVSSQRNQKFTTTDKQTIFSNRDKVFVVKKTAASHDVMEFF